jgi:hypothetical protein
LLSQELAPTGKWHILSSLLSRKLLNQFVGFAESPDVAGPGAGVEVLDDAEGSGAAGGSSDSGGSSGACWTATGFGRPVSAAAAAATIEAAAGKPMIKLAMRRECILTLMTPAST